MGVKNITGWGHRVLSSVLLASGPGCSQALGEPTGPGIRVTFSAPWHFFCLLKLLAISVMEILVKPVGLNPYDSSSESLAEHFESFRGWGPTPEIQIQSLEPGETLLIVSGLREIPSGSGRAFKERMCHVSSVEGGGWRAA